MPGVLVGAYYDGWHVKVNPERRRLRIEPPPGQVPVVYQYEETDPNGILIFKADA